MANLYGMYLKVWRYSSKTEILAVEILARDTWTREQWECWQKERLEYILNRAATQVPHYKKIWDERKKKGDYRPWNLLENWPILEKESLRENPRAFLAQDCNGKRLFHEHTSGTTGKSIDLWWSKKTVETWYAYLEARCRHWHGVSRFDRWAILGGQLIVPIEETHPPFWIWNQPLNQLYMSSYHISAQTTEHYLKALQSHKIKYLWGYTSSLYSLAYGADQLGLKIKMAVVFTNAEPLYPHQREVIEKIFQCSVRETYGMAEIVATASECPKGQRHLWPEIGIVEIVKGDQVLSPGEEGELVCTGLLNDDMPLIRYRIGDTGKLPREEKPCACGRTLPCLDSIQGRTDDLVFDRSGRSIGRLDPIFKSHLPIKEAQIIQESLEQFRLKFVPEKNYDASDNGKIEDRLKEYLGDIKIMLEPVSHIPRTENGKFKAVISKLSDTQKKSLRQHGALPKAS